MRTAARVCSTATVVAFGLLFLPAVLGLVLLVALIALTGMGEAPGDHHHDAAPPQAPASAPIDAGFSEAVLTNMRARVRAGQRPS